MGISKSSVWVKYWGKSFEHYLRKFQSQKTEWNQVIGSTTLFSVSYFSCLWLYFSTFQQSYNIQNKSGFVDHVEILIFSFLSAPPCGRKTGKNLSKVTALNATENLNLYDVYIRWLCENLEIIESRI